MNRLFLAVALTGFAFASGGEAAESKIDPAAKEAWIKACTKCQATCKAMVE